jgi:sec-independent protein translocase protein TatB
MIQGTLFLLIFESLGTAELILIGIVALIFLGPRKLPAIAKTIGKTMADLRNTTNEFKSTWEREVNFEEEAKAIRSIADEPVARDQSSPEPDLAVSAPEVRQIDAAEFESSVGNGSGEPENGDDHTAAQAESSLSDKRNWL